MRRTLFFCALTLATVACGGAPTEPASDEGAAAVVEEAVVAVAAPSNVDIVLAGYAAFNARDIAASEPFFAEDVVWSQAGTDESMHGRAAVMDFFQAVFDGHSDFTLHPARIFSSGDTVVAEVVTRGTQDGEFMGMPASGAQVGVNELHVFEFENGQIASAHIVVNQALILGQVGAHGPDAPVPPLAPLPEGDPAIVGPGSGGVAALEALAAAVNAHDFEAMAALGTDGTMTYDFFGGQVEPFADHAAGLTELLVPFPDLSIEAVRSIEFDGWVYAELVARGTGNGEFNNAIITGYELALDLAELYRVGDDGTILEQRVYADPMQMMGQLGMLGDPNATSEDTIADDATDP